MSDNRGRPRDAGFEAEGRYDGQTTLRYMEADRKRWEAWAKEIGKCLKVRVKRRDEEGDPVDEEVTVNFGWLVREVMEDWFQFYSRGTLTLPDGRVIPPSKPTAQRDAELAAFAEQQAENIRKREEELRKNGPARGPDTLWGRISPLPTGPEPTAPLGVEAELAGGRHVIEAAHRKDWEAEQRRAEAAAARPDPEAEREAAEAARRAVERLAASEEAFLPPLPPEPPALVPASLSTLPEIVPWRAEPEPELAPPTVPYLHVVPSEPEPSIAELFAPLMKSTGSLIQGADRENLTVKLDFTKEEMRGMTPAEIQREVAARARELVRPVGLTWEDEGDSLYKDYDDLTVAELRAHCGEDLFDAIIDYRKRTGHPHVK